MQQAKGNKKKSSVGATHPSLPPCGPTLVRIQNVSIFCTEARNGNISEWGLEHGKGASLLLEVAQIGRRNEEISESWPGDLEIQC